MRVLGSLVAVAGALLLAACAAGAEEGDRFPTSEDYGPEVMQRVSFTAGVPEEWRISALRTPERPDAAWKVVILTGTPSWSEYWAPTIAAAPENREIMVADRPGFAESEPQTAVRELATQAEALAPMLEARPGQRVVLLGQSFGAPLAALMAARHPDKVHAIVLVSPFFGDRGPTARRLIVAGSFVRPLLPRDLRNSITELTSQSDQLPEVWTALRGLEQPLVFIHGDSDSFVPLAASERIAAEYGHTLIEVPGGDHFLNACCVTPLWDAIEQAIAEAEGRESADPPASEPASQAALP